MMDPSGINNFEEQWRKAFQEASETPPPALWDKIEAHLDKDEKGSVVPLWWKSARMWYAAASFAILLVAGGIFYFNGGQKEAHIQVAANKQTAPSPSLSLSVPADSANPDKAVQGSDVLIAERKTAATYKGKDGQHIVTESEIASASATRVNKTMIPAQRPERDVFKPALAKSDVRNDFNTNQPGVPANTETNSQIADAAAQSAYANASIEMLKPIGYDELDVLVQKRYVFFKPEIKEEEPVKPAQTKEYWAAVGLMPASFNPDLKVKEAPLAFTAQSLSSRKSTSGTSQAGASYALQTQGGVRLSKHWSVELGISYLKGNSSYEGGGYVLSAYNSRSANVLENAMADLASSPNLPGKSSDFVNNGSLYIDVAKPVSNNYQYLQLPVQAGFTIRPDKKLSYALLAGMTANYFLSNDLESASGEIITTKASDEIYRSVNWAASTGLRFSYRLSSQWNANLTGSYQKAVSSGFRSNQSLDAHPYLYGVSWGVRYTF